MKTALTRLATATLRGLVIPVLVIAGLFACSDAVVEPLAIEGPTEYELVTDILSQPRGPTTSRRLNIAQGQDPDVARRHLRLWATTPDGNTLFQPGEIKAVRRMPPGEWAADGDTPEPRCEFVTGGSAEEYNAFKECKKAAEEDENCDAEDEDVSILVRDEDGGFRVVIIALHVHCADEEGETGDPN